MSSPKTQQSVTERNPMKIDDQARIIARMLHIVNIEKVSIGESSDNPETAGPDLNYEMQLNPCVQKYE